MDILPDNAPAPRLCHLIKWLDFEGYGFNLHAERSNPGQFIGKIDEDSPAQMAGLREGDRIVEVNGVNISNENHRQVVERIKSNPNETKLLVLDPVADLWYKEQEIVVKSSQLNVIYSRTPTPRPQPDSPRAKFHQQPQQLSLSPSSLTETSDFNDDSIEQQGGNTTDQQQTQLITSKSPAPMSPDSGKGDEEPAHLVTVEAEINRQSSVSAQETQEETKTNGESQQDMNTNIQSDSLSTDALSSQSPAPSAKVDDKAEDAESVAERATADREKSTSLFSAESNSLAATDDEFITQSAAHLSCKSTGVGLHEVANELDTLQVVALND